MVERQLAVLVLAGLLAACGGGGGGSSGASPTGAVSQGGFVPSSATSVIAEGGSAGSSGTIRYSSTGSLSVGGSSSTVTQGGTVRRVSSVEAVDSDDGKAVVIYSPGIASVSSSSPSQGFEHTSYGIWLESDTGDIFAAASDAVDGVKSFVIGNPTPVSAMPQSGRATYDGSAVAIELRAGAVPRPLSGSLTATADFATNRLDATANLQAAGGGAGLDVSMPGLAISGNRFSGSASGGGLSGSVEGGFAGPAADELGGVFELNGAATVYGAFAGKSGH